VNPFEIAIYVSLFLAIAMIVVGLRLLARGVIRLSEAGTTAEGLSIELFNKVKVRTGYPAIAFFGLGVVLIVLAIFFTKPAGDLSLSFKGKIDIDPELVTGKVVPIRDSGETFRPDSDGTINRTLHPEFPVEVQINAAGYEPEPWHKGLALGRGKTLRIDLSKEVKFIKRADSKRPEIGQIASADELKNAPPVQKERVSK